MDMEDSSTGAAGSESPGSGSFGSGIMDQSFLAFGFLLFLYLMQRTDEMCVKSRTVMKVRKHLWNKENEVGGDYDEIAIGEA